MWSAETTAFQILSKSYIIFYYEICWRTGQQNAMHKTVANASAQNI